MSALAVLTVADAANAADLARRQQMPVKALSLRPGVQLVRLLRRYQRRWRMGHLQLVEPSRVVQHQCERRLDRRHGRLQLANGPGDVRSGRRHRLERHKRQRSDPLLVAGCETKNDWLGTFRGRGGYAFDRVLPYVMGGLAVGDIKANSVLGSASEARAGWTAGAGVEAAIAGPVTAKVEYLYADLGKMNCDTAGAAAPFRPA